MLDAWDALENEVERIVEDSSEPFDGDTLIQCRELVEQIRGRVLIPKVGRGYWPTICLSWDEWQIEIFADRYELYRFSQGRFDLQYFQHSLGDPVPTQLLERLPTS